ncbi:DUF4956 domain-containing protein [Floccifex porci]|uniref:DUF4956 domain-containing protein n=1 Tax=Floccifex porci TaxID=2606629 RepID=A0A7X2T4N7_9FIRM|nr:DUF4956 domain-containing protein [Floccifex porci]MSS02046.1 DUF4956 domain-containing protein [Floccifex porci]
MNEFIVENLLAGSTVSFFDVAIKLFMALVIGVTIYIAYYFTSSKVSYNSNFNLSLVAMAIITTAIMAVITNNIALSLGMVGALSIIRFRTAIKDPRDAMFIFWSIMVGICCGVAQYVIAIATTMILFLFFILAKAVKEERRYILIIRCEVDAMEYVKSVTYQYFKNSRISVQNTTSEYAEFIYELKKIEKTKTDDFLKKLYACKKIECANFVLQEDKASV